MSVVCPAGAWAALLTSFRKFNLPSMRSQRGALRSTRRLSQLTSVARVWMIVPQNRVDRKRQLAHRRQNRALVADVRLHVVVVAVEVRRRGAGCSVARTRLGLPAPPHSPHGHGRNGPCRHSHCCPGKRRPKLPGWPASGNTFVGSGPTSARIASELAQSAPGIVSSRSSWRSHGAACPDPDVEFLQALVRPVEIRQRNDRHYSAAGGSSASSVCAIGSSWVRTFQVSPSIICATLSRHSRPSRLCRPLRPSSSKRTPPSRRPSWFSVYCRELRMRAKF